MLDQLIEAAKRDLSGRTSVPVAQITLVAATPQEWRDSSLGCPEPGGMYAQVITPGYKITLQSGGKQYEYHSDSSTRVVYCRTPS